MANHKIKLEHSRQVGSEYSSKYAKLLEAEIEYWGLWLIVEGRTDFCG